MGKEIEVINCPEEYITERDGVVYRNIDHITYSSQAVGCDRHANVVLPIGYTIEKQYPVMYVLHGIFGNESTMLEPEDSRMPEIMGNMALSGLTKEVIAVFVDMYASKIPLAMPTFCAEIFEPYNSFIDDLIGDLMPYIESHYSCLTDRESRAIFGFSMGAMEALNYGMARSDLFGYIGAASPCPGLIPGKDWAMEHKGIYTEDALRPVHAECPPNEILICCGSKDSVVGKFPFHYHEVLENNDVKHIWVEVPELEHNEPIVQSAIYMFMQLWFPQE